LLECFCGASFVDQVVAADDKSELDLCASFEEKLTRSEQETASSHPLFAGLSLNSLLRLIWSLGIVSLMPEGKPVPGKVTRAPDVTSAVCLVRAAIGCLHTPPTRRDSIWLGAELSQDLNSDELQKVCSFVPMLAAFDSSIQRSLSAQLELFAA
jgi:hypothetical protein